MKGLRIGLGISSTRTVSPLQLQLHSPLKSKLLALTERQCALSSVQVRCFSDSSSNSKALERTRSFGYPGESSRLGIGLDSTRFLVTGASGQIGQELIPALRKKYGKSNVIASDIRMPSRENRKDGPFVYCDVLQKDTLTRIVLENGIDCIVHNASLLSAIGEKNPQLAMRINTNGFENVLDVAQQNNLRVFAPSTIAVFGPDTPRHNTPDLTVMRPTTIYGITKVYLELLGTYYHDKYGLDFRSLRYPGVISSKTLPGGGTTDYAVEIYYEALRRGKYTSFLTKDTALPMMYMDDCVKATMMLLEAPNECLSTRVYNITSMSFSPEELAASIKKFLPDFEIDYAPDFRQDIANTWPASINDDLARKDWNWKADYDIDRMTEDMLHKLTKKFEKQAGNGNGEENYAFGK
mmetsp:Transcript_721/g.889  ORF Transcript_721/g.889 Transcript_721/m.889 type:complete len:409 (+) Transcript_721:396-1622(+)|eukprot:CAMPEP_0204827154 /NCGR_PEP_ID=MMETSP1346-20131115/4696_1 /ASSEMBLY_ACC=CAM_ASM_000771 /TAXON_ID=215587 /ORGANISM="Aplanochytrium stocchinoi, Strain GSBS06" /LENGTH=408 /DNA_ID=CAMNT_0051955491 /DNA_START=626 /DNA_END=1852 /DNA_ORIENTATION=+